MNNHDSIENIFRAFSNGSNELDGRQFAKLAKDCKLLDKKLTNVDVDLIFAKVKDKSARKIVFSQFDNALDHFATKKGVSKGDVIKQIEHSGGPTFNATKASYNKFHDDKSLYTGVYANGGPTNVDVGRGPTISSISQICDRTPADIRGRKIH